MEKYTKKKILLSLILIIVIIAMIIASVFMSEKEENLNNEIMNKVSKNEVTVFSNTQNETQLGPKDPVDDNPSTSIETPVDSNLDGVTGGNPTN